MDAAIRRSVEYLRSEDAHRSLAREPYWPKWHSPWWHMVTLWELGLADLIPQESASAMVSSLKAFYLPFFYPVNPSDIPPGKHPVHHIPCHCALAIMYQVLTACRVDVDGEIPWIRRWFLKYQLPDGGLNCDEAHYSRENPRSSIASTLPCLDAILRAAKRPLSADEISFLDNGAAYLLRHKLYRRQSTGEVMDPAFTEFIFPRFYGYDILRGLTFLVDWAAFRNVCLPADDVSDPLEAIRRRVATSGFRITRSFGANDDNYVLQTDGTLVRNRGASVFPLLAELSASADPRGILSSELKRVEAALGGAALPATAAVGIVG